MTKLLLAAASAVALASAAQATPYFNFDGQMGSFGDLNVTASPFDQSFLLPLTTPGTISLSVLSNGVGATNIDFTSVLFDGNPFTVVSSGLFEYRTFAGDVTPTNHTITVSGVSGGNAGYSGIIAFNAATAAVPEPASWAMLIAGFGLLGTSLRVRRAGKGFAQAV